MTAEKSAVEALADEWERQDREWDDSPEYEPLGIVRELRAAIEKDRAAGWLSPNAAEALTRERDALYTQHKLAYERAEKLEVNQVGEALFFDRLEQARANADRESDNADRQQRRALKAEAELADMRASGRRADNDLLDVEERCICGNCPNCRHFMALMRTFGDIREAHAGESGRCRCGVPLPITYGADGQPLHNPYIVHQHERQALAVIDLIANDHANVRDTLDVEALARVLETEDGCKHGYYHYLEQAEQYADILTGNDRVNAASADAASVRKQVAQQSTEIERLTAAADQARADLIRLREKSAKAAAGAATIARRDIATARTEAIRYAADQIDDLIAHDNPDEWDVRDAVLNEVENHLRSLATDEEPRGEP